MSLPPPPAEPVVLRLDGAVESTEEATNGRQRRRGVR